MSNELMPEDPGGSFMERYGAALVEGGYSILPIAPREKFPARHTGQGYVMLSWERYRTEPAIAGVVRSWAMWPDCGIGIICGKVVAIDIDIEDEDLVRKVYGIFNLHLGATPAVRIGREPRKLLVYRTEIPFRKVRRGPVEVLAEGQQFVAYGIHPAGHEYRWPGESLHDIRFDELPLVTEERVLAALDEVWKILPDELKQSLKTRAPTANEEWRSRDGKGSVLGQAGNPDAIENAMLAIPNDDLHWEDWNKIGMAVYAALGDDGLPLFERWSAQSAKHGGKGDSPAKRWAAYRRSPPNQVGAGTIYHIAQQYGWRCPPEMSLQPLPEGPEVDMSGLMAVRAPNAARSQMLPLLTGTELLALPESPRQWLVHDWIPDRQVTILSGDGGTGKSTLALQLAVAAATGTDWLGMVVSKRAVLYLAAEDDVDEFARRLTDIQRPVRSADLDPLRVASLAGADAVLARFAKDKSMSETPLLKEVERACTQHRPGLLVLDTNADLFGGDENDRQQVRAFMNMLRRLALEHGMAVLLLSHPSISAMANGRATSGSTAWPNSARSVLQLQIDSHSDGGKAFEPDPDARKLSVSKSNYSQKGHTLRLRYEQGYFVRDRMAAVNGPSHQHVDAIFLELFRKMDAEGFSLSPSPNSSSYAPVMFESRLEAGGVTKRAFKAAMMRLLANGALLTEESGPPSKPRRVLVERSRGLGEAIPSELASPILSH